MLCLLWENRCLLGDGLRSRLYATGVDLLTIKFYAPEVIVCRKRMLLQKSPPEYGYFCLSANAAELHGRSTKKPTAWWNKSRLGLIEVSRAQSELVYLVFTSPRADEHRGPSMLLTSAQGVWTLLYNNICQAPANSNVPREAEQLVLELAIPCMWEFLRHMALKWYVISCVI